MNATVTISPPQDFPPSWAGGWGEDERGVYAEICVGGYALEMRWIAPGTFTMGSPDEEPGRWDAEGPQHEVTITRGYWLASVPCPQEFWEAVMGQNPSRFKGGRRPVDNVSWHDTVAFCRRLNDLVRQAGATVEEVEFRLPTEAEWEYACRAGTSSAFNDGSSCTNPEGKDEALMKLGWHGEGEKGETHPVGEKLPNAWGLYDLHGNVWEWCADRWTGKYPAQAQVDPEGPEKGAGRVIRGGSYWFYARLCRSASRNWLGPDFRDLSLGFRLAAGYKLRSGATGQEAEGADAPG